MVADDRPLLQLSDEVAFIEMISSKRSDARAGMQGIINSGVMSDSLFEQLIKEVGAPIVLNSEYLQAEWLKIIKPIIAKQRLHYANCLDVFGDRREGVGLYAKGKSVYGVDDLLGNV